jgi:hypothetical protein
VQVQVLPLQRRYAPGPLAHTPPAVTELLPTTLHGCVRPTTAQVPQVPESDPLLPARSDCNQEESRQPGQPRQQ